MSNATVINYFTIVERENSRLITSWHIILQSLQNMANYKAPCIATSFTITIHKPTEICQVSWNKNIKMMQNSSQTLMCVSNDMSSPIGCWHVSPWKSRHFGQSKDAAYLGENVLKLIQSDCETCHQSNFATCYSTTPKLL